MTRPRKPTVAAELVGAREALQDAEDNLSRDRLRTATNRAYYATFHAARAVLWGLVKAPKSHRGVQQLFNLHVIKAGLVDKGYSEIFQEAFEQRELADYHDQTSSLNRAEVATLLKNARTFVERMEEVTSEQQSR